MNMVFSVTDIYVIKKLKNVCSSSLIVKTCAHSRDVIKQVKPCHMLARCLQ